MIDLNKHISKNYFFEVLEKRLREYEEAIFGTMKMFGMHHQMMTSTLYNLQKIKEIDSQNHLFGATFWGYGINSICDGKEEYINHDVEEIKKIGELNKHHKDYRHLLLLTFKVQDNSLFVSTFSIDSCSVKLNSNINTKYDLSDFQNARIKTRSSAIYVEFYLKKIEKPISFQLETYSFGGRNVSGRDLAKYYLDGINELAIKAKVKNSKTVKTNSKESIYFKDEIDRTESELRKIVVNTLVKSVGTENFETLLTGDVKKHVRNCIKEYITLHPNLKETDFISIKKSIQFFNIEHFKKVILNNEYWQYFEQIFRDKEKINKYFEQFNTLRKAVMHNRKITKLVSLEGKAAMEWFRMIIK